MARGHTNVPRHDSMNASDTAASSSPEGSSKAAPDDSPSRSSTPTPHAPEAALCDDAEPPPAGKPWAGQLVIEIQDATSVLTHAQIEALTGLATDAITEAIKLSTLGTPGGEVLVRIVDDAEMTRVHEEFLEDATTTDVITFDLTNGGSSQGSALDINAYVCLDEAQRQASERSHDVLHELTLYVLHAALHCLGENDATDDAYERMHAREDEVLTAIGLGSIFATGEGTK